MWRTTHVLLGEGCWQPCVKHSPFLAQAQRNRRISSKKVTLLDRCKSLQLCTPYVGNGQEGTEHKNQKKESDRALESRLVLKQQAFKNHLPGQVSSGNSPCCQLNSLADETKKQKLTKGGINNKKTGFSVELSEIKPFLCQPALVNLTWTPHMTAWVRKHSSYKQRTTAALGKQGAQFWEVFNIRVQL